MSITEWILAGFAGLLGVSIGSHLNMIKYCSQFSEEELKLVELCVNLL